MKDLPEPDATLARRVFEEAPFEQRLVLFHYGRRTGPVTITIYTMWEILGFLELPHPEFDLEKLAGWIDAAVGDTDLAHALRDLAPMAEDREKKFERIKYLIALRLQQCRSRLG